MWTKIIILISQTWTLRTKSLSDLLSKGLQLHSKVPIFFFHHLTLHTPHTNDGRGKRRMRTEEFGIQRETGVMANRSEEPMRGAPQRGGEVPALRGKMPFVVPHLCR